MDEQPNNPVSAAEAEFARAVECLNEWFAEWGNPIMEALYSDEVQLARERLALARTKQAEGDLPAEANEALTIMLTFMDYRIRWHPPDDEWNMETYLEAKRIFSIPAEGRLANLERINRLLTIRFHADLDKFDELTSAEVRSYLAELPVRLEDSRVWHQIAGWAFDHRDEDLLGQALASMTIHPASILGQARWQRVNLMYQLVCGKATRRDVLQTIKTLQVRPQLVELRNHIWPECVKAGLIDEGLEQQLAERAARIESQEAKLRPERKTKSIRNS